MKSPNLIKLALTTLTILLSACSEEKITTTESTVSLDPYILTQAPADPTDIADLRKSATTGDTVTFAGKALGADKIFMDNRATMILGDPKVLTSCDLATCKGCETPWDVCCDLPEEVTASILTVQIVDNTGKPLKAGIKGLSGIKELTEVIVTGQVAKGSNQNNMIINATGIYITNQPKPNTPHNH